MAKKKRTPQQVADMALVPGDISLILGMPRHKIAAALREAHIDVPLVRKQARVWAKFEGDPPDWYLALAVEKFLRHDRRQARKRVREFEEEVRMLLVEAQVIEKLKTGNLRAIRTTDEVFVAECFAFNAMKQLDPEGESLESLKDYPLTLGALKWAGVDPEAPFGTKRSKP